MEIEASAGCMKFVTVDNYSSRNLHCESNVPTELAASEPEVSISSDSEQSQDKEIGISSRDVIL